MPEDHTSALAELVGAKGLLTGADAEPYLIDWRGRQKGDAFAVVLPASTGEVAATMRYCAAHGLKVYPQGGNTGLCAGAVPAKTADGIVLCTRRLNAIREVDALGNVMVVEAGVPLARVQATAEANDRAFPLHLGSEGTAQIGGLISTNAGGTGALRYGTMRDLVLGIEAVLPDGSVVRRLGGVRKDNRGYDWKHLLIGAEGSLGIVTAAALKTFPRMRSQAHAICAVDDPAAAVQLFGRLRDHFDTCIHACELLSRSQIDLALKHVDGLTSPWPELPDWMVMISLGDADPEARLEDRLSGFLEKMLLDGHMSDAILTKNLSEAEALWTLRHSLSEANKRAGHGIVFDVGVRVSDVPAFISGAYEAAERIAPMADRLIVSHLGDGNVHFIAMLHSDRGDLPGNIPALTEALFEAVHDVAEGLNGSFSAEHGIGRKLVAELADRLDPAELSLMRAIKVSLDPHGRMAPGVVLAPLDDDEQPMRALRAP